MTGQDLLVLTHDKSYGARDKELCVRFNKIFLARVES